MCLYLATIFHYVRPDRGDFKLYDKRKPIPEDLSLSLSGAIFDDLDTSSKSEDPAIPDLNVSADLQNIL